MSRRCFLAASACAAVGLLVPSALASVAKRPLHFYHTHTGERTVVDYSPGSYDGAVRQTLEYFLRDFRTGDVHEFDPLLFDSLCAIQHCCGKKISFEIISGYRSAKTNELLRKNSSGVARKSLHMQGRALDIRVTGMPTKLLRDLALDLHRGGVGFYPKSNFIHIDSGRKRNW